MWDDAQEEELKGRYRQEPRSLPAFRFAVADVLVIRRSSSSSSTGSSSSGSGSGSGSSSSSRRPPPTNHPPPHTPLTHIRFTRYLQYFRHVGTSYEA